MPLALLLLACTPTLVDYHPRDRDDWSYAEGDLGEVDVDACSDRPDPPPPIQLLFPFVVQNQLDEPVDVIGIGTDCTEFPLETVDPGGMYTAQGVEGDVFQLWVGDAFHSAWRVELGAGFGGGTVHLQ